MLLVTTEMEWAAFNKAVRVHQIEIVYFEDLSNENLLGFEIIEDCASSK